MKYILTSNFYSDNGKQCRLRIFDNEEVSNLNYTFDCSNVNIQYRNDEGERFSPIISSQLSFNILIENSTQLGLINNIALSNGNRYFVEFYIDSSLEFFGIINIGDFEVSDSSMPYDHNITANDGLTALKDIKFGTPPYTYLNTLFKETLLQFASRMLRKNEWVDDYYSTTEYFLRTAVDWWADNMPTKSQSSDPLALTRITSYVFGGRFEDEGNIELGNDWNTYSAYEILEFIVSRFNARLFYAKGQYNIIQPSYLIQDDIYIRTYKTDLSSNSYTDNLKETDLSRLTDGVFGYFMPVKETKQNFVSIPKYNILPFGIKGSIFSGFVDSYFVETGDALKFSGTIKIKWDDAYKPVQLQYGYFKYKLYIKSTNYSLGYKAYPSQDLEWKNNTTSYVPFELLINWQSIAGQSQTFTFDIPDTLEDDVFSIKIEPLGYREALETESAVHTFPTGFIQSRELINYMFKSTDSNPVTNLLFNFEVDGSSSRYSYELPNQIIGDEIPANWISTMETYDGSSWKVTSGGWKDGESKLTSYFIDIFKLCSLDFLHDQQFSILKYIGGIITDASFLNSLVFDDKVWIINSGTYDYNNDEWSNIECYNIETDTTVFTVTDNTEDNIVDNLTEINLNNDSMFEQTHDMVLNNTLMTNITKLSDSYPAGTYTTVDVDVITEITLNKGDVVVLEHPLGKNRISLTIDEDQEAGDLSIIFQSAIFPVNFPIGSIIRFHGSLQARMIKHKKEGSVGGFEVTSEKLIGTNVNLDSTTGDFILNGDESYINNIAPESDSYSTGRIYADSSGYLRIKL